MTGAVLSRLTTAVALAEFPALSVAVPLMDWPAPSVDTITGEGHVAMPAPLSVQVNVTVTLVLFQPAVFGDGAAVAVITGGALSTPFTRMTRREPGLPRSSTRIALVVRAVTLF